MQAIKSEVESGQRSVTYSAAMAACEKAGQWELAVELFDKVRCCLVLIRMAHVLESHAGF